MTDREALKVRPNTGVPTSFLHNDVVLCCGEDREELMHAVHQVFPEPVPSHKYRCYEFWRYPSFTLILTGIGTGCLEPLLWEILDGPTLGDQVARRLVNFGTAGYLSADSSGFGKVFHIEAAYPVGCGVHLEASDQPIKAKFPGVERLGLPRTEGFATDYYYSCSPRTDPRILRAQSFDRILREESKAQWKMGRIIDMETAQFYHFCRCYGDDATQYVTFRGVANMADQFAEQATYSLSVLTQAFDHAVKLLTA